MLWKFKGSLKNTLGENIFHKFTGLEPATLIRT